ncbi:uncharacterized protein LOC131245780 isoform X2 [Magnolia sinica]|uniref:uncharacterized protein LOC131245780 isoform X2 n=1 Tax=Magnolia sinica TaxID=86752 RepID=UPI002657F0A1|nr:uncharacterized protein LOC131245780 isoform X2 [Magnolia sinica]
MYPRVKVKGEEVKEGPVATQEDRSSLLLRVFESLSLHDRHSPGNEYRDNSPPHARIPKSYVPITPMPSVAASKGTARPLKGKNNKEIDADSKTNIRASSVPRPRAVLSSPDNDGMIGSRNKLSRGRHSVLKTRNSDHVTLTQGKTILKKDSPSNTRRVSKEADSKPHPKEKHATEQTVPQQKVHLRKGKPSTAGV